MSGIARASILIGAGTIVSRVTGLLRTIVLVAAVGAIGFAGDAFAVANQLPNNIYVIISTGLLTAVIVPQIVKVSAHADGGQAFISKLLTLGTVVLIVTTGLAIAVAPWLVAIYAPDFTPDQLALATAFAYWCLPQIFFYGVFALLGEISTRVACSVRTRGRRSSTTSSRSPASRSSSSSSAPARRR